MRGRSKWFVCAGALAVGAGAAALVAGAAVKASPPPVHVDRGITGNPMHNGRWIFPDLRAVHAKFLVMGVEWRRIATARPASPTSPADPAYDWSSIDAAFQQAKTYGIEIVPLVYQTPTWANGNQQYNRPPQNVQDYANFCIALLNKYPQIKRLMVWGEPSRGTQWVDQGQKGATEYADLLDAAYVAIHSVRNVQVIGGNTFNGGSDDAGSTSAGTWAKRLVMSNGHRPRMDMWGMNPFTFRPIDMSQNQVIPTSFDFNDLDSLGAILDRYWPQQLKFFVSEIGLPTDHGNNALLVFYTRAQQAAWLKSLFAAAAKFGRVAGIGNYLLYDDAGSNGWTTGLITDSGRRKPAWFVYRRLK